MNHITKPHGAFSHKVVIGLAALSAFGVALFIVTIIVVEAVIAIAR